MHFREPQEETKCRVAIRSFISHTDSWLESHKEEIPDEIYAKARGKKERFEILQNEITMDMDDI